MLTCLIVILFSLSGGATDTWTIQNCHQRNKAGNKSIRKCIVIRSFMRHESSYKRLIAINPTNFSMILFIVLILNIILPKLSNLILLSKSYCNCNNNLYWETAYWRFWHCSKIFVFNLKWLWTKQSGVCVLSIVSRLIPMLYIAEYIFRLWYETTKISGYATFE